MSPEKEELFRLQELGEYVFHGTSEELALLEPRQAIDEKTGADGPPAVFASDRVDYAIFMAIVNAQNCKGSAYSRAGGTTTPNGSVVLRFGMTKETANNLTDTAQGWVYVFPRSKFTQRDSSAEYTATVPVVPLQKIRVSKADLPENIEIDEG